MAVNVRQSLVALVLLVLCMMPPPAQGQYYGALLGDLETLAHDVRGTVYMVDAGRLMIRNFHYDGSAPDAFFWVGERGVSGSTPDRLGTPLADGDGSRMRLYQHRNAHFVLTLPQNKTIQDYQWLAVWCRMAGANFGAVQIPDNVQTPASRDVTPSSDSPPTLTSGTVTLLDNRRIRIHDFTKQDTATDLFFYAGSSTVNQDNAQQVPDEKGSTAALGVYTARTIDLTLPAGLTLAGIEWLVVWDGTAASREQWRVNVMVDVTTSPVPPYTETAYYGEFLGRLTQGRNMVRGNVFVVDNKRFWLRLFSYDGGCSEASFRIGRRGEHSATPSIGGIQLPNERGVFTSLDTYSDSAIVLTLPGDTVMPELAWLSVWCETDQTDMGSLIIPATFTVPNPFSLGEFSRLAHRTRSGPVTILDKRTFRIEDFTYDGFGPDAFFLVDTGSPSPTGMKIPDHTGSRDRPRGYNDETFELTLPGGQTVDQIDYLSLYCITYTEDFGNVRLDQGQYNVPPYIAPFSMDFLSNCESMNDDFNVAWEVMGDSIVFEFSGSLGDTNGYMAFGISGSESSSAMIGSDPMIVYLRDGTPTLADYYITAYSLCSGDSGVCPDTDGSGTDDLSIIMTSQNDGITTVRFRRPLDTGDATRDKSFSTSGDVYVVWATGNVNNQYQVTKHTQRLTGNKVINFGRSGSFNCDAIDEVITTPLAAWPGPRLSGQDTQEFTAFIGPTGGPRGYQGITGQVSWGISWYLNGLLIPELTLRRGETYTFNVHGGRDPNQQARYHPFYITDDPVGGYAGKTEQQKQLVTIYAGGMNNNQNAAEGSYCEYYTIAEPDNFDTFADFAVELEEECEMPKEPGTFTWTPDDDTPDLVYYQCFTHNYLGWKIHVVDDYSGGASNQHDAPYRLLLLVLAAWASFLY